MDPRSENAYWKEEKTDFANFLYSAIDLAEKSNKRDIIIVGHAEFFKALAQKVPYSSTTKRWGQYTQHDLYTASVVKFTYPRTLRDQKPFLLNKLSDIECVFANGIKFSPSGCVLKKVEDAVRY